MDYLASSQEGHDQERSKERMDMIQNMDPTAGTSLLSLPMEAFLKAAISLKDQVSDDSHALVISNSADKSVSSKLRFWCFLTIFLGGANDVDRTTWYGFGHGYEYGPDGVYGSAWDSFYLLPLLRGHR